MLVYIPIHVLAMHVACLVSFKYVQILNEILMVGGVGVKYTYFTPKFKFSSVRSLYFLFVYNIFIWLHYQNSENLKWIMQLLPPLHSWSQLSKSYCMCRFHGAYVLNVKYDGMMLYPPIMTHNKEERYFINSLWILQFSVMAH